MFPRLTGLIVAVGLVLGASSAVAQAPLTEADAREIKAGFEAFFKSVGSDVTVQGPIATTLENGTARVAIRDLRLQRQGVRISFRDLRITLVPDTGPRLRFRWEHAPEIRMATEDGLDLGRVTLTAQKAEGVWDRTLGTVVTLDAVYRELKATSPNGSGGATALIVTGGLVESRPGQWRFGLDWRIADIVSQTPEVTLRIAAMSGRETSGEFSMPDYLMATKTIGYGDLPGFRFFAGLSTGAFRSLTPRSREDGERLGKKLAESVVRAPELIDRAFGVPLAMQFEVADLSLVDRVGSRGGFTRLAATGTSSGLVDGMGALALTVNVEGITLPSSVADPAFVPRQARLALEFNRVPVRQALVKAAGSFGAVRSLALSDDGAFRVHTPEIAAWLLGEARTIVAAAGTEVALSDLTLANPTYRIGIKGAARAAPQARMLFSGEVTIEAEGLDALQGAIERSPQTAAFVDVFAALRAVGTRDAATGGRSRHVYRLSLADDGRFTVNDKDVMALGATLGEPGPGPFSDRPRTGGAVRSEAIEQPLPAPGRPSVQRETLGIQPRSAAPAAPVPPPARDGVRTGGALRIRP